MPPSHVQIISSLRKKFFLSLALIIDYRDHKSLIELVMPVSNEEKYEQKHS